MTVPLSVLEVEFPCGVCEKYVARDSAHALELARANWRNYADDDEWEEPEITRLPDDKEIQVLDEVMFDGARRTMSARDWVRENGPGILCTNTW